MFRIKLDEAPLTDEPPIRGVNRQPAPGWPWHLTDYEISYVERFNVRPLRDESWAIDAHTELRLDQEADGVRSAAGRQLLGKPPRESWLRARAKRRWPWILATSLVAVVAVGLLALSGINLAQVDHIEKQTHSVNAKWR
jgi:hypothetical protein